jgi:hypothetical protein
MIGDRLAQRNSHVHIDVLDDIIANYNSRPHRTLSEVIHTETSPADISEADEDMLRDYDFCLERRRPNRMIKLGEAKYTMSWNEWAQIHFD